MGKRKGVCRGSIADGERMMTQIDALGRPDVGRYGEGSWPAVLLNRMAWWVRRVHGQGKLLDLGCAEGFLLDTLGMGGIGLDMNPARLRLAARKGIRVCLGDANILPFPDACFDTVISMEMLEHVPEMGTVMDEVRRVLGRDGRWIVSVPSVTLKAREEMRRQGSPIYCDEREHYREFSGSSIPWFEHKFMAINELEKMLGQHGFELLKREGLFYQLPDAWLPGGWLKKLMETGIAHKICSHLPVIRNFPAWSILILRKCD